MGKLYFPKDAYVNGVLTFKAGQQYEIDEKTGSYDRWLRRGAVRAEDLKENLKKVEPVAPLIDPNAPLTKDSINPKTGKKFTKKEYADYEDELAFLKLEEEEAAKLAAEALANNSEENKVVDNKDASDDL